MNHHIQRVLIIAFALFCLIFVIGPDKSIAKAAGPICSVDGNGGGADYTTIAAAIADTGCTTIHIAPGTYVENLFINRDLTLQGAGAGITIIDGNGAVTHQRVIDIDYNMQVKISDLTIQNGQVLTGDDGGGGIRNRGDLTLSGVILTHNQVEGTASGDIGGAVSPGGIGGGKLMIDNSTISHNSAARGGGVFFNSTLAITNTLFYSNTAIAGGAITSYYTGTLVNVTLSDNSASNNGGAITANGSMTLVNSTIVGNTAPSSGGISPNDPVSLVNTILADNGSANCFDPGLITSLGHNLESSDTCGLKGPGDLANTDPLLGPLQDNGGPSWTYELLEGSPAIDAGDQAACPATDQRGMPRPFDGNRDGTPVCDIGAYEAIFHYVYLPLIQH